MSYASFHHQRVPSGRTHAIPAQCIRGPSFAYPLPPARLPSRFTAGALPFSHRPHVHAVHPHVPRWSSTHSHHCALPILFSCVMCACVCSVESRESDPDVGKIMVQVSYVRSDSMEVLKMAEYIIKADGHAMTPICLPGDDDTARSMWSGKSGLRSTGSTSFPICVSPCAASDAL